MQLPRDMPANFREVEVRIYSKIARDEIPVEKLKNLKKYVIKNRP